MTIAKKLLSNLAEVQFGTIYNFFGRKSQTMKGSLVWASRKFQEFEKARYIRKIEYNEIGKPKRYNQFYYCTPLGARKVDKDYRYKERRSILNTRHESAKIDIALSFVVGYPNLITEIEYEKTFRTKDGKPYTPDIVVKLKTPDYKKEYHFLIEIERFREPSRVYREKLTLTERLKPFKHYRLLDKTKILIVYTNRFFEPFWRPQQYGIDSPDYIPGTQERIGTVNNNLYHLINLSKDLPDYLYRFMPFHEFINLHKSVWFNPKGKKVSLINS